MRVSSVQEALNGHSNDTVITPYTLNQVLDTLPSGEGGGGITEETDPIFKRSAAYGITSSDIDKWNNTSGGSSFSGDYDDLTNKPDIPDSTSDLVNDSGFITSIPEEYKTKSENDALYQPKGDYLTSIPEEYVTEEELNSKGYITQIPEESDPVFVNSPASDITDGDIDNWNTKQEPLVSGQNIKTINNQSLLGSGNINISGGGSSYIPQIGEVVTFSERYVETLDITYQEGKTYYSAGPVPSKFGYIHPTYTALVAGTDYNIGDTIYKAPTDGSAIDTSAIVYEEKNPALYYGGEWSLIDKMFYNAYRNGVEDEEYTRNSTNCTDVTEFYWLRSGHTISIAIRFTNKVQIAGTNLEMFTIDYKALGTTRIYRIYRTTSWSDLAGCLAFCSLHHTTGVFTTVNMIPDNYISAGRTDNSAQITINVAPNIMLDECCDRFIWKRIS